MQIDLTFDDLMKLAATGRVEKDGAVTTVSRPVFTELRPENGRQLVVFSLDETDPRSRG